MEPAVKLLEDHGWKDYCNMHLQLLKRVKVQSQP
jgi:hypothetical protein